MYVSNFQFLIMSERVMIKTEESSLENIENTDKDRRV